MMKEMTDPSESLILAPFAIFLPSTYVPFALRGVGEDEACQSWALQRGRRCSPWPGRLMSSPGKSEKRQGAGACNSSSAVNPPLVSNPQIPRPPRAGASKHLAVCARDMSIAQAHGALVAPAEGH